MNEQERKDLEVIGGKQLVDMVTGEAAKRTKNLEELGIAYKQMGDYATRLVAIAEYVEEEAVKNELLEIAAALAEYEAMEYGGGETVTGGEMLVTEGEMAGEEMGMEYETAGMVSRKEVGDALVALITEFRKENQKVRSELKSVIAEALAPVAEEINDLNRTDAAKIASKADQTPAASLQELIQSAIGAPETEVKAADPLAGQGPVQADPRAAAGLAGLPSFVANMLSEKDLRR